MTAARTEPVIDADGHVFESDSDIFEYLPAPYKGADILFATPFFPGLDGFHRQAQRVTDGRAGVLEIPTGDDWLAYLDVANIALSVLFPTSGLGFGMVPDPEWACALAHGYNDYLYDRFLRLSPDRLKGMALIPLQDPLRAIAELRRAVDELGMVGAILPAAGSGRLSGIARSGQCTPRPRSSGASWPCTGRRRTASAWKSCTSSSRYARSPTASAR